MYVQTNLTLNRNISDEGFEVLPTINEYFKKLTVENRSYSIQELSGVQTESHSKINLLQANPSHALESYLLKTISRIIQNR